MTQFATTYTRFDQVGVREDLSDIIYNISPTETPFVRNAGKGKCDNTIFDWQTDALDTPSSSNQQIEGDDVASIPAATPTVRPQNYCQISRKLVSVSGTARSVDTAGRKDEFNYQMSLKSAAIKRDIEKDLLENKGAAAGSTSSARKTGSLLAWIKSNKSTNGGTAPVYTTIPTDVWTYGTPRAFTEALLKDVLKQLYDNGANVSTVMVGSFNKQAMSGFTGVVELTSTQKMASQATIIGAASAYVSDFGNISIVPNRFQVASTALVLDYEMVEISYLRPMHKIDLAKTGDADKAMILAEYGLKVKNELGIGAVMDLTTS